MRIPGWRAQHRDKVMHSTLEESHSKVKSRILCEYFPYLAAPKVKGYKYVIVSFRNQLMTGRPEADCPARGGRNPCRAHVDAESLKWLALILTLARHSTSCRAQLVVISSL